MGDTIILQPQDDPSAYRTKLREDGRRSLKRDHAGNCVYLGKRGCQIHGRAPVMCRRFDCREYALAVEKMDASQRGQRISIPSIQEGVKRLAALGIVVDLG